MVHFFRFAMTDVLLTGNFETLSGSPTLRYLRVRPPCFRNM